MSEMKRLFENTWYRAGYSDASYYLTRYGNKLDAINDAITDYIDHPGNVADSSYTYGYLDAISKGLGELINEARNETITTYIKEEKDGSREDDSGSEGDSLSGDRDDNGEAGRAEEDCTECDGSDQDSPEAN